MVQLKPSDESEALIDTVRRFTNEHLRPLAREKELCEVPAGIEEGLHSIGVTSPVAAEHGGQGLIGPQDLVLVAEQLARADAGIALDVILGAHAATMVATLGTESQARAIADVVVDNPAARGTVLYFEGFGRSPLELATSITETPTGWRIEGRKTVVSRPGRAAFGVLVTGVGSELSALLLPSDSYRHALGVRDSAARTALGLGAATLGTVDFDGDVAGATHLVAAPPIELHRSIAALRLAVASVSVGVALEAINYASHYATERRAFGRSIADYQGVTFPLADASMAVDGARLGLLDQAGRLGRTDSIEALASATADAVARATRAAQRSTVVAINTLGGHGFLTDHPVERYYRDAAMLASLDFDPLADGWADGAGLPS